MPPTRRRSKPISVVEGRRLYEQTNLHVDHIAAMMGLGKKGALQPHQGMGLALAPSAHPAQRPAAQA